MEQSKEENNRIIAEFMGRIPNKYDKGLTYSVGEIVEVDGAKYADSWEKPRYDSDWRDIMPVVQKIGEIDNEWLAEKRCPQIEPLMCAGIFTPIDSVFNYVVQFILWYNKQTLKR